MDLNDWLIDPFVLETINNVYNRRDCWLTHGSFIRESNKTIQGEPYPDWVKKEKAYRRHSRWLAQHLRTFRGFLWNNINKEDLKNKFGKWPTVIGDLIMTYPMLEMCPPDKVYHISSVLYNYNDMNPLNDFRIKANLVKIEERMIKEKPIYKELIR